MSVYKRKNGIWFCQFQFQGKTFIKSSGSTRKTEANALERKMRDDLLHHVVMGLPKDITCEQAIDNYLEFKKDTTYIVGIRAQAKWYKEHLKGLYLHQLTTARFHELLEIKKKERTKLSNNTLLSYRQFVLGVNKLAKQQGYKCSVNFETPKIPAVKGKLRYLSYEEESRLLTHLHPDTKISGLSFDTADPRHAQRQDNYDLVVLLLDTGARVNEIAKLTWDSIDLDAGKLQLWRPKVRNESVLYLPDRSLSMLRRRYENRTNEFVFTNGDGTKAKNTVKGIRNAFDRVGLTDCTPHTLRHTFASRMIQNGMGIYEVMHMLGHSKIETTQIYAHLDQAKTTEKARDILNVVTKEVQRQSLRVVGGQGISR